MNEILRLLRVYHDMKSIELSGKLGISPSYLSEIEHGKKEPTLVLIKKYSEVFNIPPSSILFFEEQIGKKGIKSNLKNIVRKMMLNFLEKIESEANSENNLGDGVSFYYKNPPDIAPND